MVRWLNYKNKTDVQLDEEGEVDECPMSEHLQHNLRLFHNTLTGRLALNPDEVQRRQLVDPAEQQAALEDVGWLDRLAAILVRLPDAPTLTREKEEASGTGE